jgi:hypothetical protein
MYLPFYFITDRRSAIFDELGVTRLNGSAGGGRYHHAAASNTRIERGSASSIKHIELPALVKPSTCSLSMEMPEAGAADWCPGCHAGQAPRMPSEHVSHVPPQHVIHGPLHVSNYDSTVERKYARCRETGEQKKDDRQDGGGATVAGGAQAGHDSCDEEEEESSQ